MQAISTCLWFDNQAEHAVAFYTRVFARSRVIETTHHPENGPGPAGSVLTIRFMLDGVEYVALNGGPQFQFSPAISLVAYCESQQEVDRLWRELGEGGTEQRCGWLTDRFGVSWQVVPRALLKLWQGADPAATQRAFATMMTMKKLDIAALERAYQGQ